MQFEKSGCTKAFKYKIGVINLLQNRRETLAELCKEYELDIGLHVMCNTEKLEKVPVRDIFKVARTAGHFVHVVLPLYAISSF